MSILIGADIVPSESNKTYFHSGNMQDVVGIELLNLLCNSDYRIFNLECPLVNSNSPIQKCGPNLRADVSTVNGLKSIGVNLLTLANNHIIHDVPAYEVWAGNPARKLYDRFSPDVKQKLINSQWWCWNDKKIELLAQYFEKPDFLFKQIEDFC